LVHEPKLVFFSTGVILN